MKNLRVGSFVCILILVYTVGCITSYYRVSKTYRTKTELSVSPDRVLLECMKVSEESKFYGFMMHVLDDQNTVLGIIQGNNLGKEDCENRIEKISKILARGRQIYIAGMHSIDEPRKKTAYKYTFPRHGTFYGNDRLLQFMFIANEKGECFGAYDGDEKPCPRDEFPISDE